MVLNQAGQCWRTLPVWKHPVNPHRLSCFPVFLLKLCCLRASVLFLSPFNSRFSSCESRIDPEHRTHESSTQAPSFQQSAINGYRQYHLDTFGEHITDEEGLEAVARIIPACQSDYRGRCVEPPPTSATRNPATPAPLLPNPSPA